MLRILTLLLAVLALLVGAAFSYFNAQPVQVDWLLGQSQLPLGLLLLGAMLGGFVLAMLLIGPAWWYQRLRTARLQKALLRQSGELDSLRALKQDEG